MKTMNYQPIHGRPCRIMWSQRDPSARRSGSCTVYVKNLPTTQTSKELAETFGQVGHQVMSAKVMMSPSGESLGYGYVTYATEAGAAEAIRLLNGVEFDGGKLDVAQFVPRAKRVKNEGWTNCYVKNLPKSWTRATLADKFAPYGRVTSAVVVMDPRTNESRCFGFVNMETHEQAVAAVAGLNDSPLEAEEAPAAPAPAAAAAAAPAAAAAGGGAPAAAAGAPAAAAAAPAPAPAAPTKLYVARHQTKAERNRELVASYRDARAEKSEDCNLYVKNLNPEVTDDELRTKFSKYGSITSARIMRAPDGTSRGFGFVCYAAPDEASAALREMNKSKWHGLPLFVSLWQRREVRAEALARESAARATTSGGGGGGMGGMGGGGVGGGYRGGAMGGPMGGPAGMAGGAPASALAQQQQQQMMMNPQVMWMLQQLQMAGGAPMMAGGPGGMMPGMGGPRGMPMGGGGGGGMPPGGVPRGYAPSAMAPGVGGGAPAGMGAAGHPGMGAGGVPGGAPGGMARGYPAVARGPPPAGGMAPRGVVPQGGPRGVPQGGMPSGGAPGMGGMPPGAGAPGAGGMRPGMGVGMGGMPPGAGARVGAAGYAGAVMGGGAPRAGYMPGAMMGGMPVPAGGMMGAPGGGRVGGGGGGPSIPSRDELLARLSAASVEERRNVLGTYLYPLVEKVEPVLAAKITGMLLELDSHVVMGILESPEELRRNVQEANVVLQSGQ